MKMKNIFISHSSKDIIYVKKFTEIILQLGLDISADRIFCSSLEGQGIKNGNYIPDTLKEELQKSELVILMISNNYKNSEICLNELGAAWISLPKNRVIPVLLPDVNFVDLGIINFGRIGIRINVKKDIVKFISDSKDQLNPAANLSRMIEKVDEYMLSIADSDKPLAKAPQTGRYSQFTKEAINEADYCFRQLLVPFDGVLRKSVPTLDDGIHPIKDAKTRDRILANLSEADFLEDLWYRYSEGDLYVEKLVHLDNGNWSMSDFNWELKIDDMWISMRNSIQYDFILIHSKGLPPYQITSDVGGHSHDVGKLKDGTIISNNERKNGYSVVNGETIDNYKFGVESFTREPQDNWIFLISNYHKLGYNDKETIELCEELDAGKITFTPRFMLNFMRKLGNHPIVTHHM